MRARTVATEFSTWRCGVAERDVAMKTAPSPSLVVAKAEFLLQVLIVALDTPAFLLAMGHPITHHSSGPTVEGQQSRRADRTRSDKGFLMRSHYCRAGALQLAPRGH